MASTPDSFQAALSKFQARLTDKEKKEFENVTLHDVRSTIDRIQKSQENTKTMRNMSRLQSFLEAMDQFGKVIAIFTNASSFVAFVWGPMKFLLQVRLVAIYAVLPSKLYENIDLLQSHRTFLTHTHWHDSTIAVTLYFDTGQS
jgi:hypothetical protein